MRKFKAIIIVLTILSAVVLSLFTVEITSYWLPRAVKILAARSGVPAWSMWDSCYPNWDYYWEYYNGRR